MFKSWTFWEMPEIQLFRIWLLLPHIEQYLVPSPFSLSVCVCVCVCVCLMWENIWNVKNNLFSFPYPWWCYHMALAVGPILFTLLLFIYFNHYLWLVKWRALCVYSWLYSCSVIWPLIIQFPLAAETAIFKWA